MDLFTLALAICFVESSNRYSIVNLSDGGSASYGWCQIKYTTAKEMGFKGNITDLWFNKKINQKLAIKYLQKQYARYGNFRDAVAAYNAGSVKKNLKGVFVNQKYVDKVFSHVEKMKLVSK